MSVNANPQRPVSAHVVVLGSQEDGSGKSTIAMHVAVALLNRGQRVATVDLDGRHTGLTRYIESRRSGAARHASELAVPTHVSITSNNSFALDRGGQTINFQGLADVVANVGPTHDFIIIDTSAADSDLMRRAHALADTLITPIDNSSDMFGALDATTTAAVGHSAYAEMVSIARERRRETRPIDWVVVCNRLAAPPARRANEAGLNDLAARLGFRYVDGLAQRTLYRDLFVRGLTSLDRLDDAALGARPSLAHVTAQREATSLITALGLPVEARSRTRPPAAAQWLSAPPIVPLGEHDLLET